MKNELKAISNTKIRLVNKRKTRKGIDLRFELFDENVHEILIITQTIDDEKSELMNVCKEFTYHLEQDNKRTRFIIQEKDNKIYQCMFYIDTVQNTEIEKLKNVVDSKEKNGLTINKNLLIDLTEISMKALNFMN